MRRVTVERAEAAARGAAARKRMLSRYSPGVLAARLLREFQRVDAEAERRAAAAADNRARGP
jgi:hypothetical protein